MSVISFRDFMRQIYEDIGFPPGWSRIDCFGGIDRSTSYSRERRNRGPVVGSSIELSLSLELIFYKDSRISRVVPMIAIEPFNYKDKGWTHYIYNSSDIDCEPLANSPETKKWLYALFDLKWDNLSINPDPKDPLPKKIEGFPSFYDLQVAQKIADTLGGTLNLKGGLSFHIDFGDFRLDFEGNTAPELGYSYKAPTNSVQSRIHANVFRQLADILELYERVFASEPLFSDPVQKKE